MGPISSPETSVLNHLMPRSNPEYGRIMSEELLVSEYLCCMTVEGQRELRLSQFQSVKGMLPIAGTEGERVAMLPCPADFHENYPNDTQDFYWGFLGFSTSSIIPYSKSRNQAFLNVACHHQPLRIWFYCHTTKPVTEDPFWDLWIIVPISAYVDYVHKDSVILLNDLQCESHQTLRSAYLSCDYFIYHLFIMWYFRKAASTSSCLIAEAQWSASTRPRDFRDIVPG